MSALARPAGNERGPARRAAKGGAGEDVRLPVRVRLADGRTFTGTLPARKHRALQLGLLHGGRSQTLGARQLYPRLGSSMTCLTDRFRGVEIEFEQQRG